jgi:ribonucleoside-diphosphate reductase alpha chain
MSRFSKNALTVLKKRYLLRGKNEKIIETPDKLFLRVARAAAKTRLEQKEFFRVMSNLEFLPNSPTLMNAGTNIGQLSACFVIPVPDSMAGIFEAVKDMALIQQSGGGTGFSFSNLRPRGDVVKTTHGVASGPVSFMHIFDETTEVIKQGGKRRGANMGILSVHHPDIAAFITSKRKGEVLRNFNISVAVTDEFMTAVRRNKPVNLINPRSRAKVSRVSARQIFNLMVDSAWSSGDPGLVFIDEINRAHPLKKLGRIEATNPCGEVPLLPYESCNLGSVNLARMIKENGIDWDKLKKTVRVGVVFLDNIIDANKYPLPEIGRITRANRKIGLGVMGFAEMLIKLGIRYDSEEALLLAERLMGFIQNEGHRMSIELGKKRGSFPNFRKSRWFQKGYPAMRNATVTTIAPTGSISLIADCTSGIEPLFSLSFTKEVLGGVKLLHKYKPSEVAVTTFEIEPEWHLRMQAAFQKYTDNAVSKTINLSAKSSREEILKAFLLAHELKCKGITVYRYGSKPSQVLYTEDSGEGCCEI